MSSVRKPNKFDKGLAFMFETNVILNISKQALEAKHRDVNYFKCWEGIPNAFVGKREIIPRKRRSWTIGFCFLRCS